MDRFEELLKELGQIINLPLHPDKHRACKLNINNVLHVQIEMDLSQDRLLIASFLCDVPPGKFREEVFREALKANSFFPRTGTFGFSKRKNQLAFFTSLPTSQLNGEKLASFLGEYITTADEWRSSIENGRPGPQNQSSPKSKDSFFGLKP